VRRWLTRPSRFRRGPRWVLALILGAVALVGIAAPPSTSGASPNTTSAGPAVPTKTPFPPGPGDPTKTFPSTPALAAEGYNLYQQSCSSCHGMDLRGVHGVAPSLIGVGAGPVDFYLSTGRMPLEQPRLEPERNAPLFNRHQINALIAYITKFGGAEAPTADPSRGDLATGFHQFTLHCAGCHQSVARGGQTIGAVVPALDRATPQQIAEAVRMGPYVMPRFDSTEINQHQLNSIARYIQWTNKPDNAGGWGIYNIGPVPEGMVAWFIGLLAIVIVARLIGERNDEGVHPS